MLFQKLVPTVKSIITNFPYYRLTVYNNENGTTTGQVSIQEFQILDDTNTNILINGTASASSSQPGNPPQYAFDGLYNTVHRNIPNDFPYSITYQCTPTTNPRFLAGYFFRIGAWDLDASTDGTHWVNIAKEPTAGWWNNYYSNPDVFYYHPIFETEMWIIHVHESGNNPSYNQYMIGDWQLHDQPGGPQLLTGGWNTGSSTNGYRFTPATDGDIHSPFANYSFNGNTIPSGNVWFGYILPAGVHIHPVEVELWCTFNANPITDFSLKRSLDGGRTYTTVGRWQNITWTSAHGAQMIPMTFTI